MTRSSVPHDPVAAVARRDRVRRRGLGLYGLRVTVSVVGRIVAFGLVGVCAFDSIFGAIFGVFVVGLEELGHDY